MKRMIASIGFILLLVGLLVASVSAQGGVEVEVDKLDADQTPEVDDVGFPNLILQFTPVNQSGVPVPDLVADDFTLIEDGTPVADFTAFRSFTDEDQGISILLVLDASGSMSDNLEELRAAAISLVDFVDLGANDEVGIIAFSVLEDGSSVALGGRGLDLDESRETSFTVDGGLLKNLVNQLQINPGDGTPLYDALYKGARLASEEANNNRRVVILMTDGVDADRDGVVNQGSEVYDANTVLQEVRNLNVPIFTIGLGDEIDTGFLQRVANATGGSYQQTPSAEQLGEMFQDIATLLKQKYLIAYESQAEADDARHALEILADTPVGEGTTTVDFTANFPVIPWIRGVQAANPRQDFKPLESFDGLKGRVILQPDVVARGDIAAVNYYVNGELVHTASETPWEFTWDTTSLAPNEEHDLTIEAQDDANPANVGSETFASVLVEECSIICQLEINTGLPAWVWLVGIGLLLLLFALFLMRRGRSQPDPVPSYSGSPRTVPGDELTPMGAEPLDIPPAPAAEPLNPTVEMGAAASAGFASPPTGRPSPKTEVLQREPQAIAFLIDTETGREFHLADGTTIGRNASNDIVLDDSSVSGQHAKLRLDGKQFALFDLGSTNHTYVNGDEIVRHELSDGDKVKFGRKALVFKQL